MSFNWSNASFLQFRVPFEGVPPDMSNEHLIALPRASIANRFAQMPQRVMLGYVVAGTADSAPSP